MKLTLTIIILALLSGCANMTPRQKTTALVVGGIVVTAIVISAAGGGGDQQCNTVIAVNASGSDHVTTCR